jgi:acetyl-CoA carboxylase biotin carboxylase subunit
VPTVPGSDGLIRDEQEGIKVSRKVGFPIMIKATAGGGGRGMRLAMTEKDFLPLLQQAQQVWLTLRLQPKLLAKAKLQTVT